MASASKQPTPRTLSPEVPVVSYPTPNVSDLVVVQDVDTRTPDYVALSYGDLHPDQISFPGLKLVFQQPLDNEQNYMWIRRVYANDRTNQDTYNYAIKYAGSDPDFPTYIRTYTLPRSEYAPLPKGSVDPLFPTAPNGNQVVLNTEEVSRYKDESDADEKSLDSKYVKVTRVYITLPGPTIFGGQVDARYGIPISVEKQIVPAGVGPSVVKTSSGEIRSSDIDPIDTLQSTRLTSVLTRLPDQQVWYGRRVVSDLPPVLTRAEIVGSEQLAFVPYYEEAPSGALKARYTRSFSWGPPTEESVTLDYLLSPQTFNSVIEYTSTRYSHNESTGTGTNSSVNSGNSSSTTSGSSNSTSSGTSSSTQSGTSSSSQSGTSSSSQSGTSSSSQSGTSNSTSSGTSSSSQSGTSSSSQSGTSSSSQSGTSSSSQSGTSSSSQSGTSSSSQSGTSSSSQSGTSSSSQSGTSSSSQSGTSSSSQSGTSSSSQSGTSSSSQSGTSSSSQSGTSSSSQSGTSSSSQSGTSSSSQSSNTSGYSSSSSSGNSGRGASSSETTWSHDGAGAVVANDPVSSRITNSGSSSNDNSTATSTSSGNSYSNSSGNNNSTSSGTSNSTSSGTSNSTSSGTSNSTSSGTSNSTSSGTSNSTTSGTSHSTSSGTSNSTTSGTSNSTSSGTSNSTSSGTNRSTSNGISSSTSNGTSSSTSSGTSSSTSSGTSNSTQTSSSTGTQVSQTSSNSVGSSEYSSASTSYSTGKNLLSIQIPRCLRPQITLTSSYVSSINVTIPATSYPDLPWGHWIEVGSRSSEHWKMGVWVTEKVEVYLQKTAV